MFNAITSTETGSSEHISLNQTQTICRLAYRFLLTDKKWGCFHSSSVCLSLHRLYGGVILNVHTAASVSRNTAEVNVMYVHRYPPQSLGNEKSLFAAELAFIWIACQKDWIPSERVRSGLQSCFCQRCTSAPSFFSRQQKPCYIWHVAKETGLHLRTIVASSTKGRTNCAEAFLFISEVSVWHGAQVQHTLKNRNTLRQVVIFH